jgi:hypothetical protein
MPLLIRILDAYINTPFSLAVNREKIAYFEKQAPKYTFRHPLTSPPKNKFLAANKRQQKHQFLACYSH